MKIKKGATRIVFIFKKFVIKIPNFSYSWDHFLRGILSNINENRTWKWNSFKFKKKGHYVDDISQLICPVLWCSLGGWILIMKKADVDRFCDFITTLEKSGRSWGYIAHINEGLGGDDTPANYGYIDDRIVKVDYGEIESIYT